MTEYLYNLMIYLCNIIIYVWLLTDCYAILDFEYVL